MKIPSKQSRLKGLLFLLVAMGRRLSFADSMMRSTAQRAIALKRGAPFQRQVQHGFQSAKPGFGEIDISAMTAGNIAGKSEAKADA